MNVTQILRLFEPTTKEEQSEAFETAREQLNKIGDQLDAYESLRLDGNATEAQTQLATVKREVEAASWSSLLQVQAALPFFARNSFRTFRTGFLHTIVSIENLTEREDLPSAQSAQHNVDSLRTSLTDWEERAVKACRRQKYLFGVGSIVMAIAAPIFLFFQYWHGDIAFESLTFMFPVDPASETSHVDASDYRRDAPTFTVPDRDAFIEEFSRFYFNHPNDFLKQHYESPAESAPSSDGDARESQEPLSAKAAAMAETETGQKAPDLKDVQRLHLIRWKTTLNNTSLRSSEYVSQLRETVALIKERPFPWAELHVSPALKCSISDEMPGTEYDPEPPGPGVKIANDGLGPAIKIAWQFKTQDGDVLNAGRAFILRGKSGGFASLLRSSPHGPASRALPAEDSEDDEPAPDPPASEDSEDGTPAHSAPATDDPAPEPPNVPVSATDNLEHADAASAPEALEETVLATTTTSLQGAGEARPRDEIVRWQFIRLEDVSGDAASNGDRKLSRAVILPTQELPDNVELANPENEPDAKYFSIDGTPHERITTASRLVELADAVITSKDKITARLTYEDMKGEETQSDVEMVVPSYLMLYRARSEYGGLQKSGAVQKGGAAQKGPVQRFYFALASAFSPTIPETQSKNTLKASLEFDLSYRQVGQRASVQAQIDANLSPQGRISIFTTARNPRSGQYLVILSIDGKEKVRFTIDTLVPELRVFPDLAGEQWEEIVWYRNAIGRKSSASRPSTWIDSEDLDVSERKIGDDIR